MRLDKYLCDQGVGTRSEVKKLIKKFPVMVNGTPVKDPSLVVDENKDEIVFKGQQLHYKSNRTYLLHKPSGCVTANTDAIHKTVFDYLPAELTKGLNAVGRLDLDTEGLLLLTTDGDLLHHLISPNRNVSKTYFARLDAPVPTDAIASFKDGVDIGDEKPTKPAALDICSDNPYEAYLTITEGRFHQVKRMFQSVGCEVIYLKRISEGSLSLGDLEIGSYRELTEAEVDSLMKE